MYINHKTSGRILFFYDFSGVALVNRMQNEAQKNVVAKDYSYCKVAMKYEVTQKSSSKYWFFSNVFANGFTKEESCTHRSFITSTRMFYVWAHKSFLHLNACKQNVIDKDIYTRKIFVQTKYFKIYK